MSTNSQAGANPASDSTRSISQSLSRFFSGTLLSRATGMLRDMTMAAAFGSHPSVAAFMTGFRLSHLLRRFFGEGALHTAFVPHFEKIRQENPSKAAHFFLDLLLSLCCFLGGLIILSTGALGAWLYWGEPSAETYEVVFLTLLMLPSLFFICLFGLQASLSQCEGEYFIPGVAPVAFNLVWSATVCSLFYWDASTAMPYLALSVVFSCFIQCLLMFPSTYRYLSSHLSKNAWKSVRLYSPELKAMLGPLCLALTGIAALQINSGLDYVFGRIADPSGPAYLWFAQRIQQAPVGLFGIALSTALLPPLSRAVKQGSLENYRLFLLFSLRKTLTLMIPLSCALIVGALASINLVFGRGSFSEESLIETTFCLWGYGLGLLPQVLILILAPAFYARHQYSVPALAATCSVIINILLNGFFVWGLDWGAYSVSLATTVSSWVNMLLLLYFLNRGWQGNLELTKAFKGSGSICLASLGAAALTFYLGKVVFQDPSWAILWMQPDPLIPRQFLTQVYQFSGEICVFIISLVILGKLVIANE